MTAPAAVAGRAMTERDLREAIIDAARKLGYLVYYAADSRRNETGYPDLCVAGNGLLLFWELKTTKGKLRQSTISPRGRSLPGQQEWLDAIHEADVIQSRVIRPNDLDYALEVLRIGYEQRSKG